MKKAIILERLIKEKFKNVRNFSITSDIPYSTVLYSVKHIIDIF